MNSQARLAELRLRGMVEYQQTPGDKAIAAKATKVLHELAMLLPDGRVVESADAFFSDYSDFNGEPLTAAWWGKVRGEHSDELNLKIDLDIKDGTYTVGISAPYMSGTGAYKAINTVLEKPPFKTDVSVGQVSRILDEVVPRVRKGLDAARSTAGAVKQKYDWLASGGKVFHRNLEGLVSRFGWGVQFYSGSHSDRDGQPFIYGSLEITGVVTPEIYDLKNPEQRRALSPFVAKARTLVQKAAASVGSVQIVVSKKSGYFSQGGLNFAFETHLHPGRALFGSQQRTSKLMSRQEAILKKYLASAGSRAVMEFDDLPANVRSALEAVKDQETLWSDVNRWLGDNAPNPYTQHQWDLSRRVNLASQGEQATSLYQQIQRIASEYPETRAYLVPLLKSLATR